MPTLGNTAQASSTLPTAAGAVYLQRILSTTVQTLVSLEGWSNCGNQSWSEQQYVVYSDNAGAPNTLLAQSNIFVSAPDFSMASRTANLTTPLALSSGQYYWIGTQIEHDSTYLSVEASTGSNRYGYFSGTFGSPPSSLAGLGTVYSDSYMAFSGTTTSGAGIDTYPSGVETGETGIAYTTTGLASVTSISIGSLAATSISDTSGDGTHSVPALVDGVAHELYGTKTVTVTGTEGSPTTTTSFQPATGNSFVTLAGTLNTTDTGGLFSFSPAAVVTDQIVFPSSGIAYDAQGNITGEAGVYNCWHIQASTKIARSYTVTLSAITPPSTPSNLDKRFIMEFIASNAKASKPLGYQQITNLTTAVGLTVPAGTAYILFKPNAQAIRFRDDDTNPTASVGYPVAAGAEYVYTGAAPGALRFIETTASATLDVLYYGVA